MRTNSCLTRIPAAGGLSWVNKNLETTIDLPDDVESARIDDVVYTKR